MKPLSWVSIIVPAAGGLLVGASLSYALLKFAYSPPLITPWLALLFLAIAGVVLWGGLGVRKFKRRETTRISAVDASRIALLARSAATTGAVFSGFLAGTLAVSLFRTWAPATASAALGAGVALTGAVVLTAVAWLVESWCVDDGDDSERTPPGRQRGRRGDDPSPAAGARVVPKEDPLWPSR